MSTITQEHLQQHVRMEVQRHLESSRHNLPWVALVFRGQPSWEGVKSFTETVKFQRRKEHQSGERTLQFDAVGARTMLEKLIPSHFRGVADRRQTPNRIVIHEYISINRGIKTSSRSHQGI